jgi:hypothetical protein
MGTPKPCWLFMYHGLSGPEEWANALGVHDRHRAKCVEEQSAMPFIHEAFNRPPFSSRQK